MESPAMEENQPLLFESFFNSISLPKLTYHWHVLLLSTLACNVTVVISRLISSNFFQKHIMIYKVSKDLIGTYISLV